MTLARRPTWKSLTIPRIVLIAAVVSGCNKDQQLTATQSAVLAAKDDYDEGPERPMETADDPNFPGQTVSDDDAPVMKIRTLTLKQGHSHGPKRLFARIHSDKNYPLMGIHAGQNIVWRDSWDSTAVASATWKNTVTPEEPGEPDHVLTRDSRLNQYPAVVAHQPRVIKLKVRSVAFVVCLEDPMCGTGHCGHY